MSDIILTSENSELDLRISRNRKRRMFENNSISDSLASGNKPKENHSESISNNPEFYFQNVLSYKNMFPHNILPFLPFSHTLSSNYSVNLENLSNSGSGGGGGGGCGGIGNGGGNGGGGFQTFLKNKLLKTEFTVNSSNDQLRDKSDNSKHNCSLDTFNSNNVTVTEKISNDTGSEKDVIHDSISETNHSLTEKEMEEEGYIEARIATGNSKDSIDGNSQNWNYEEQFKQLYEISDDPKRKEFLDELFSFMQKRGNPVNRIPIMAKQVLDLYALYKLVISRGGLVEVINKKLWREITKGLNLPSSITSAAFTLRTQYMKYLYPYECERLKLSTPSELQAAIDGNRREARRPAYNFEYQTLANHQPFNPAGFPHGINAPPNPSSMGMIPTRIFPPVFPPLSNVHLPSHYDTASLLSAAVQRHHLNTPLSNIIPPFLNSFHYSKQKNDIMKNHNDTIPCSNIKNETLINNNSSSNNNNNNNNNMNHANHTSNISQSHNYVIKSINSINSSTRNNVKNVGIISNIPGSNISLPDSSIIVSMEVNGLDYHGILFAKQSKL